MLNSMQELRNWREEYARLLEERARRLPLWRPFLRSPQEAAYHSQADELFFGGAAGPGKTALLIGLALCEHWRSLILRRQATQLEEVVEQLKRFAGTRGSWCKSGHGGTMTMRDGRMIQLAGCDDVDDWLKYAGRPHDLLAFDEGTSFTVTQYKSLAAWNRTTRPNQRCRIVVASNPPSSAEGRWVLDEWAPWLNPKYPRPAVPGELRWYTVLDNQLVWVDSKEPFQHKGETVRPQSRTFIPARLADNPVLSASDNYRSKLQALPEPLRSQLLYGDFLVGVEDDPWQVIPTAWVEAAQARWTKYAEQARAAGRWSGEPGQPVPPPAGVRLSALGVDVARGGDCKTVVARRYGSWFDLKAWPGKRTPDGDSVAMLVKMALEENPNALVNIDAVGIGSSAFDSCKRLLPGARVLPVLSGNHVTATDRAGVLRFASVRAYLWWALRELLDPAHANNVSLPPSRELLADLTAPTWKMLAGVVLVEKKEDIVQRLGRSPDLGDAICYSLIMSVVQG